MGRPSAGERGVGVGCEALTLAEPHLRPSTLHGYRDHIDSYLIPSIGRITLADLTGKRLQACFRGHLI